ncbi:hypothetical protein [Variovorax guangxiensis]|nr:hypothetical protein [Variovorax guangxiensis]MDR6860711.1 hypothetical protein [Variovorax guangxiensis]
MNTLHSALQDYLALRRGLGYKMHDARGGRDVNHGTEAAVADNGANTSTP